MCSSVCNRYPTLTSVYSVPFRAGFLIPLGVHAHPRCGFSRASSRLPPLASHLTRLAVGWVRIRGGCWCCTGLGTFLCFLPWQGGGRHGGEAVLCSLVQWERSHPVTLITVLYDVLPRRALACCRKGYLDYPQRAVDRALAPLLICDICLSVIYAVMVAVRFCAIIVPIKVIVRIYSYVYAFCHAPRLPSF